ncbi:Peptidase propeptide and YPEB protein, partial [human gut metagenome]
MNKKLISMALTGVLAVGMLSVATPSVADARKTKPETSTDISVKRAPGESIVM